MGETQRHTPAEWAKRLVEHGLSQADVARMFQCSQPNVGYLLRRPSGRYDTYTLDEMKSGVWKGNRLGRTPAEHRLRLRLPADIYTQAFDAAERDGLSVADWVRRAIERDLSPEAPEK